MKALVIICVVSLVFVTSFIETAEAGRRRRRRAGAVAAVAASSVVRREPVATRVARPAVAAATTAVTNVLPFQILAAPDLTIAACKGEGDMISIEIMNKGQATAAESYVQLEFIHPDDGKLLAMQKLLISPLQAGEVTTLQLPTYGLNEFPYAVRVDSDNSITEISESNNLYSSELEEPPLPPRPVSMEKMDEIVRPLMGS